MMINPMWFREEDTDFPNLPHIVQESQHSPLLQLLEIIWRLLTCSPVLDHQEQLTLTQEYAGHSSVLALILKLPMQQLAALLFHSRLEFILMRKSPSMLHLLHLLT